MIIIKLGGSIITNKQKPLTAKPKIINAIVEKLKTVDEQYIIVHGGGSFGHYWSVKYNMHTEAKNYDKRGISVVKNSMIELNKIVSDIFYKNDLFPYVFPASNFIDIDGKTNTKKDNRNERNYRGGINTNNIRRCFMVSRQKIIHIVR